MDSFFVYMRYLLWRLIRALSSITIFISNTKIFNTLTIILLAFFICYSIACIVTKSQGARIVISLFLSLISILSYISRKAPISNVEMFYRKIRSLMQIGKYSAAIKLINESINIEMLDEDDFKNDGHLKRIIFNKALCHYELYCDNVEYDEANLLSAIKEFERCIVYFDIDEYPYEYCYIKNNIAASYLGIIKSDGKCSCEFKLKTIDALDCAYKVFTQHAEEKIFKEVGTHIRINYIDIYVYQFLQNNDINFLSKSIMLINEISEDDLVLLKYDIRYSFLIKLIGYYKEIFKTSNRYEFYEKANHLIEDTMISIGKSKKKLMFYINLPFYLSHFVIIGQLNQLRYELTGDTAAMINAKRFYDKLLKVIVFSEFKKHKSFVKEKKDSLELAYMNRTNI